MRELFSSFVTAVLLLSAGVVHAEAVWTDGIWTAATAALTPAEQNLVCGKTPTIVGSTGSEGCGTVSALTDGTVEDTKTTANVLTLGNNATLTWTFDEVKNVRGVRIFTQWGNANRSRVTVTSITGAGPNGEAVTLVGDHNYDSGTDRDYSAVADDAGGVLGQVRSITVCLGAQENGYVGFSEIEVVGEKALGEVAVTGAPDAYGLVAPAYGSFFGTSGETATFTAQAFSETEDTRSACVGWKLFDAAGALVRDSATGCGAGESETCCKIPYQDAALRLEWQWAAEFKVAPTSADASKGSASASSSFVAVGETATVTATPEDGFAFHHWENVPAGANLWANPLELTVTEPLAPQAVFGRAVPVSDAAGLEAAVAAAQDLDVIELAAGTYAIGSRLEVAASARLTGVTGKASDVTIDAQKACKAVSLANALACLSSTTSTRPRMRPTISSAAAAAPGSTTRCAAWRP